MWVTTEKNCEPHSPSVGLHCSSTFCTKAVCTHRSADPLHKRSRGCHNTPTRVINSLFIQMSDHWGKTVTSETTEFKSK